MENKNKHRGLAAYTVQSRSDGVFVQLALIEEKHLSGFTSSSVHNDAKAVVDHAALHCGWFSSVCVCSKVGFDSTAALDHLPPLHPFLSLSFRLSPPHLPVSTS